MLLVVLKVLGLVLAVVAGWIVLAAGVLDLLYRLDWLRSAPLQELPSETPVPTRSRVPPSVR
jgi:hypothetical protein